jgi:hypothetical protein
MPGRSLTGAVIAAILALVVLSSCSKKVTKPPEVNRGTPILSLTIVAPEDAPAGTTLTYSLAWSVRSAQATHATITDSLPANVTFTQADSGGTFSGSKVVWNLGTRQPGDSGTVHMSVTLAGNLSAGTLITNIGTFSAAETSMVVASARTTIAPPVLATVTGWVAFTHYDSTAHATLLYKIRLDGTSLTSLSLNPEKYVSAMNPRWSPDGTRIVFEESIGPDEQHLAMVDSSGHNKQLLNAIGSYVAAPSWSPDGNRIAYWPNTVGDLDGRTNRIPIYPSQLVDYQVFQGDTVYIGNAPQWATDELHVYLTGMVGYPLTDTHHFNRFEIFEVDIQSGLITKRLTHNLLNETGYQMSPDGTQFLIPFVDSAGNHRIGLMALTDSFPTPITSGPQDSWPRWARDGRTFVYLKNNGYDGHASSWAPQLYLGSLSRPGEEKRISSLPVHSAPDIVPTP